MRLCDINIAMVTRHSGARFVRQRSESDYIIISISVGVVVDLIDLYVHM